MSEEEFRKLYQAEFTASEPHGVPWNLAKEYYQRCDRYDADVCSGRRDGVPVPATDEEFRLINRHALKVLRELEDRCMAFGFSKKDLREAMREYIRSL